MARWIMYSSHVTKCALTMSFGHLCKLKFNEKRAKHYFPIEKYLSYHILLKVSEFAHSTSNNKNFQKLTHTLLQQFFFLLDLIYRRWSFWPRLDVHPFYPDNILYRLKWYRKCDSGILFPLLPLLATYFLFRFKTQNPPPPLRKFKPFACI